MGDAYFQNLVLQFPELAECDPPYALYRPIDAMCCISLQEPSSFSEPWNWSQDLIGLLAFMLVKDPKHRPSASQTLKHSIFKTVNSHSMEELASIVGMSFFFCFFRPMVIHFGHSDFIFIHNLFIFLQVLGSVGRGQKQRLAMSPLALDPKKEKNRSKSIWIPVKRPASPQAILGGNF